MNHGDVMDKEHAMRVTEEFAQKVHSKVSAFHLTRNSASPSSRRTQLTDLAESFLDLANFIRQADEDYRQNVADPMQDDREPWAVGGVLLVLDEYADIIDSFDTIISSDGLLNKLEDTYFADAVCSAAKCIAFWIMVEGESTGQFLRLEGSAMQNLQAVIRTDDSEPTQRSAFRSWATNLLASAAEVVDHHAETLVQRDLLPTLFSRLDVLNHRTLVWPSNVPQVFVEGIQREKRHVVQLLSVLSEYEESVGAIQAECAGANAAISLMTFETDEGMIEEVLRFVCALLIHRSFGRPFVQKNGVQHLLSLPMVNSMSGMISLCLSSLVRNPMAMEELCQGDKLVISELSKALIWLLNCPGETARKNACVAISFAVQFPLLVKALRSRAVVTTLLAVMHSSIYCHDNRDTATPDFPADILPGFTTKESGISAAHALRQYFRAELVLLGSTMRTKERSTIVLNITISSVQSAAQQVRSCFRRSSIDKWRAGEALVENDGIQILVQFVRAVGKWRLSEGASAYTVEIFEIITLFPNYIKAMLVDQPASAANSGPDPTEALVLLVCANTEVDLATITAALRSICNLVHPAGWCLPVAPQDGTSMNQGSSRQVEDDGLRRSREAVRSSQGIQALLWRLQSRTPANKADRLRELACRALLGMSRQPEILNVLSRHDLGDNLSDLIRSGPVSSTQKTVFEEFRLEALELIARTNGRLSAALVNNEASDPSALKLSRAAVAAATPISYSQRELLLLIHEHLLSLNLDVAAEALASNASLHGTAPIQPGPQLKDLPGYGEFNPKPKRLVDEKTPLTPPARPTPQPPVEHDKASLDAIVKSFLQAQHAKCARPSAVLPPFSLLERHVCTTSRSLRSEIPRNPVLVMDRHALGRQWANVSPRRALNRYIFSRFRHFRTLRQSGSDLMCTDFAPPMTISGTQREDGIFCGTSSGMVEWHSCEDRRAIAQSWVLGDAIYDLQVDPSSRFLLTASEQFIPVQSGEAAYNGGLALWNIAHLPDPTLDIEDAGDVLVPARVISEDGIFGRFSSTGDRVLSTGMRATSIFNVETGTRVNYFRNSLQFNQTRSPVSQQRGCTATWSPTDELVVSNGGLWDPRRSRMVHRFESLGGLESSSIIHRNNREVIMDAEVWDLRMFKLLRTCHGLHGAELNFNGSGSVIFGSPLRVRQPGEGTQRSSPLPKSCFRALDAVDYCEIQTTDLLHPLHSLSSEPNDRFIATTESRFLGSGASDTGEVVVRLYEVGKTECGDDAESHLDDGDNDDDEDDSDLMGDDFGEDDGDDDFDFMSYDDMGEEF